MEHWKPLEWKENYPQDEWINNQNYTPLLKTQEGYKKKANDLLEEINSTYIRDNWLFIKWVGKIEQKTIKEYMKINNIEWLTPLWFKDVINLVPDYEVNWKNLREDFLRYIENQKNSK